MKLIYKIALGVIVLVAIGAYWYVVAPREDVSHVDTSDWVLYTNEEFGFSLMHPPTWQVHEAPDDLITPKFNIHKPNGGDSDPPYTHHSQQITHVSIFPNGIPTEGISGESKESSVEFSVPIRESFDYLLSNGEVWATFAGIETAHPEWNESGFIFARTAVFDRTIDCFRENELLDLEQCSPLEGDRLIRHGTINANDRAVQETILTSFTLE